MSCYLESLAGRGSEVLQSHPATFRDDGWQQLFESGRTSGLQSPRAPSALALSGEVITWRT